MKTKSDAPLSEIVTAAPRNELRQPSWRNGKPVVAFDTETRDGEVFMLSVSDGRTGSEYVVENGGDPLRADQLWRHVAAQKWGGCICVWFNIGFDAEVIASSALTEDEAERLQQVGYVEAERDGKPDLEVTYLKGKLLRIKDEHGNGVTHYDIGSIVRGSLDTVAEEWVGETKLDGVDTSRFGDAEYIRQNYYTIKEYARKDARVTREVAEAVLDKAESIGIPAGRPVSTGYLAAEFLREHLDRKPGWGMDAMQSLAWDAYAGGRFEVFRRGDVGRVAGPDINSAYPAVMAELPDPSTLAWEVTDSASLGDVRDADYGFVEVNVTTDASRKIQPFAEKVDGTVTYPAMDGRTTSTLIDTFLFAVDAGLIQSFSIEKAALGYETAATTYPFDFFEELYEDRKTWESEGREKAALMLKIVLNSMYGKTAQTTIKRDVATSAGSVDDLAPGPAQRVRVVRGRPIIETQEAGSLFNPFIASYITGRTRLKLHETVHNLGLEEETIMFATDCVMVEEDAFDASEWDSLMESENDSYADALGKWDFDYRGDGFIVGSGVYEVLLGEPEDALRRYKLSTRGFREAQVGSLREAAQRATWSGDGEIPIHSERPVTLGEAMSMPGEYTLKDVGRFRADRNTRRGLRADFDSKRVWPDDTTYVDLLESEQTSDPLVLD